MRRMRAIRRLPHGLDDAPAAVRSARDVAALLRAFESYVDTP